MPDYIYSTARVKGKFTRTLGFVRNFKIHRCHSKFTTYDCDRATAGEMKFTFKGGDIVLQASAYISEGAPSHQKKVFDSVQIMILASANLVHANDPVLAKVLASVVARYGNPNKVAWTGPHQTFSKFWKWKLAGKLI